MFHFVSSTTTDNVRSRPTSMSKSMLLLTPMLRDKAYLTKCPVRISFDEFNTFVTFVGASAVTKNNNTFKRSSHLAVRLTVSSTGYWQLAENEGVFRLIVCCCTSISYLVSLMAGFIWFLQFICLTDWQAAEEEAKFRLLFVIELHIQIELQRRRTTICIHIK